MRPLLWKEARDLRPWLAFAAAAVIALQLLCRSASFENNFMSVYLLGLMPLTATLSAIALGTGQVARERRAGTLDFLLTRPLPAAVLVWTKFLAGTVALGLLLAALVVLGYRNPAYSVDSGITAIRSAAGAGGLLLALFPRFWLLYALSLLLSVLFDRTAKAAAAIAVAVIAFLGFAFSWSDLAPFSGVEAWLPFFESTGALVRVARDPALLAVTGLPLCAAALFTVWLASALLRRSAERYAGTRALIAVSVALTCAAVLAAKLSAGYLPVTHSAGALTLALKERPSDFAADGPLAALGVEDGAQFLDFSDPAHPHALAPLHLPLWTTHRIVLYGSDAYLTGTRKAMPRDELQILPVRIAEGAVEPGTPIALGTPDPGGFVGATLRAGGFLYVTALNGRDCQIRTFELTGGGELTGGRELPPITVDNVTAERKGRLTMALREPYLYVASPSYLTTIDLARAAIVSRLDYRDTVPLLHGLQRRLVPFGDRLFEESIWPQSMSVYSLADPRRPAPLPDRTWHRTGSDQVAAGGAALYQPWGDGVLAFRPEGRAFSALADFNDGPDYGVHAIALAGNRVYTVGYDRTAKSQRVAVFDLAYPAGRAVGGEAQRRR